MSDYTQLEALVSILRHGDRSEVRDAIDELRANGWLKDGSLTGAHLRDAKLTRADLVGANLASCDLSKAALNGAMLANANLQSAILIQADLFGCNLQNADLRGARLHRADLHLAQFVRTDLQQADFTDAICQDTVFADVDLSEVNGLETVRHNGLSELGIRTLYRSKGHIPKDFLQGCGLPNTFLNSSMPIYGQSDGSESCLISFSENDRDFAHRLFNALMERGIRCSLDQHYDTPVRDFYNKQGVYWWDKLIFCCSQSSLRSWWYGDYVMSALEKEQSLEQSNGVRSLFIIPLDLDGYLFETQDDGRNRNNQKPISILRDRIVDEFASCQDPQKLDLLVTKLLDMLK